MQPLKESCFVFFPQLNRVASLSDCIQLRIMMIMHSTASRLLLKRHVFWLVIELMMRVSWWMHTKQRSGMFFSCLSGLINQITRLPSVTDTFYRNICAENKSTWASQPLCHHGQHVCWLDAVPVGRSFMFCSNMVTSFFKRFHFTAKRCTKMFF